MTIFKHLLIVLAIVLTAANWSGSSGGVSGLTATDNLCIKTSGTGGNLLEAEPDCVIADNGIISAGGFETSSGTVRYNGTTIDGGSGLITFGGVSAPAFDVNAADTTAFTTTFRFRPQNAATMGIIIKAHGSQTASLQEWQNNSDVALLTVTADGNIVGNGATLLYGMVNRQLASTTASLSIANCGATVVSNSADVQVLPEASTALGCRYTFVCGTADDFDINPADATDAIGITGALTPAAGDALRCTDIGAGFVLEAVGADLWAVISTNGTITDVN